MEFKQNKFLPAEKQIVTACPDINTVCVYVYIYTSWVDKMVVLGLSTFSSFTKLFWYLFFVK